MNRLGRPLRRLQEGWTVVLRVVLVISFGVSAGLQSRLGMTAALACSVVMTFYVWTRTRRGRVR